MFSLVDVECRYLTSVQPAAAEVKDGGSIVTG